MWKQAACLLLGVAVAYWIVPRDNKLHTLKGRRVLVTGASEGIGEQLAYHYARLGANVVVTARTIEKLNKVVTECHAISPSPHLKHFAVSADMSKLNDTKFVIQKAVRLLGGLDILVLNHITKAPIRPFKGTTDDLDYFQNIIDVNFRSYVFLTSHALPQLLANEGSIVVVNSLVGKLPHPYLATYSASKHALNGFYSSLRNQFINLGQNVSVTSCTLGLIATDNGMKGLKDAGAEQLLKTFSAASPNDTALAIVTAGAMRVEEVYTPYLDTRPIALLYGLWPNPVEYFLRYLSRMTSQ